jgi:hypothetical protein
MQDLTLNLVGFPAVNRDLKIELREPSTQNVIREVQPFLDGTVRVPHIDPGAYQVTVRHPNVALPVMVRDIRVLPQGDTKISLVIDPSKFRNTPIEDIPDANLGPVEDTMRSIAETVLPLPHKVPGEAILAQDWNTMASAVRDLANAVGQLTHLVSPIGHNHPELEKKFAEVSGNFDELINSVTASLTELQRQMQTQRFKQQVEDLVQEAGPALTPPDVAKFRDVVTNLERSATSSPVQFSRDARNAAVQLQTQLTDLLDKKKADPEFAKSEPVAKLQESLELVGQQRATTYDAELAHYRKVDRSLGGAVNIVANKR